MKNIKTEIQEDSDNLNRLFLDKGLVSFDKLDIVTQAEANQIAQKAAEIADSQYKTAVRLGVIP